MLMTGHRVVRGLAPVADAFSGTVTTSGVHMKNFQSLNALIYKGVGTTGVSTITVEKCTAANGSGAEAIPFYYRRIQSDNTQGAWTKATASGFSTTAGSDEIYEVAVDVQMEELAEGDKPYVRVKAAETVDSAVIGAIVLLLSGGRYGNDGAIA